MKPEMSQGKKWSWEPEPRAEPGEHHRSGASGVQEESPWRGKKVMCPSHELGP